MTYTYLTTKVQREYWKAKCDEVLEKVEVDAVDGIWARIALLLHDLQVAEDELAQIRSEYE